MGVSDDYITYVLDQLAGLGPLRVKRMFGGAGIYCDELFFAILVADELYLKVDDRNRGDFERLGLGPFTYVMKNGRGATMNTTRSPPTSWKIPNNFMHGRERPWMRPCAESRQGGEPRISLTLHPGYSHRVSPRVAWMQRSEIRGDAHSCC